MVFQEMVEGAKKETFSINIEKLKRRSINIDASVPSKVHSVDPKINPARFSSSSPEEETYQSTKEQLLALWKFMRYLSINQDEIPCFIGLIALYSQKRLPTSLTYLSPLQNPIREVYTMTKIFEVSQNLSKKANMKYAHIILDPGAAIKGFHVIWNQNKHWKNIIIHLGDFHAFMAFMAFFGVGKSVTGIGFKEIVFQPGLCTSGSITCVLLEKHYNRYI